MAQQKTRPSDADVQAFLEAVTPTVRREDGLRLARILQEVTGADPVLWGPSIVGYGSYRIPSTGGEWPKVGFSPRRAQLSIYGLKDLPAGARVLPALGEYTEGAGCVYVKRLDAVDEAVLRKLAEIAWSRGDDDEE
ncbi:MAG: DUF1801 domain-containing protein [Actinobacteria bacterium]|nr:DUF1801 domain-containing protein [Actinomycetota bacterium]